MKATAQLRQMLASDRMTVAPFVLNALHARIAEDVGHRAVYMTGAGTAAERGFPDVGLLTMTEMVANAKYIADAVNIPVICDADTGYGNPLNVQRTVREYEAAGVAAIHLEDQLFPKKCGFFAGKQVVPVAEHVQKIRAALDARRDPDFVIIARCDAYAVNGWKDTVARCRAYVAAGADLVFVDGIKSQEDIRRYASDLSDLPRMYNGDLANTRTMDELGYKVMICGSTIWLIYKQVRAAYEELMNDGKVDPERYGTRWDVASALGLDAIYELEKRYGVQDVGADVAGQAAAQAAQMAADAGVNVNGDRDAGVSVNANANGDVSAGVNGDGASAVAAAVDAVAVDAERARCPVHPEEDLLRESKAQSFRRVMHRTGDRVYLCAGDNGHCSWRYSAQVGEYMPAGEHNLSLDKDFDAYMKARQRLLNAAERGQKVGR